MPDAPVQLDDKWTVDDGRVLMSGTQALARVLLAQHDIDRRCGWHTAGYVSGYRGSPLGNVDTTLWSIAARLKAADIVFQPGLNEDIAATALRGTQQLDSVPEPAFEGVFAAWYSKGPGVDRSGDAIKHGNYMGASSRGGVLLFYGDDHGGKSSTVAHQSEQALAANLVPSLYPATVQEMLEFGLAGIALSRASGSWVGIKCVNEIAEQTATVEMHLRDFEARQRADTAAVSPAPPRRFDPLGDERVVIEQRLPRVQAFVRARGLDRIILAPQAGGLGLVTAGKSYGDVRSALELLGLSEAGAAAAGISLCKVGCIWPLEPTRMREFARGQRAVLVVEEKKSFLEQQLAALLINQSDRPLLIGKLDEHGAALLSSVQPLEPWVIAHAILDTLERLGLASEALLARRAALPSAAAPQGDVRRMPYFCSGCPHNRSTLVPEGSFSMTGIGCHTMANFVRPDQALLPTQMGGEGGNWLGLAPFTRTKHMFQNMGDGTYFHSGLLAIRAAVAAGVNITFKILYNDAVAMTGGQPVDGPLSVPLIASQVLDEGVKCVYLLSDAPDLKRFDGLPSQVKLLHRDRLDEVQRQLREMAGCTILIYEQTCAAEKRRRRKRGTYADPPKRLFIATAVCEACGDCSVQSSCISIGTVETPDGRKRVIDQSSCNKDYSCANGFCPSFLTVYDAKPRRSVQSADRIEALPPPVTSPIESASYDIMVAGIGGTGVITVGALLGMAAHLDGLASSSFDMTGLSQKNGAVFSHVRIARRTEDLHAQRIGRAQGNLLLAFDTIAALAPEASATLSPHTRAVINDHVAPTAASQWQRDYAVNDKSLNEQLASRVGAEVVAFDATGLAQRELGDSIGANLFVLGVAAQRGWLPMRIQSLEAAVRLNGVAVELNLRALALGRRFALAGGTPGNPDTAQPQSLEQLIADRSAHLQRYQDAALVRRFRGRVDAAMAAEQRLGIEEDGLTRCIAKNYAKVLAYKDEYEVARLLSSATLKAQLAAAFESGGRIAFNLAPPMLHFGNAVRPAKHEFGAWLMGPLRLLARLKGLRGTYFDPFRWTADRRAERALIVDYEKLIDDTLRGLNRGNYTAAVTQLSWVEEVRGFGPVKLAALKQYRERLRANAHPPLTA